ncbi:MAG: hypothetical protein FWC70_09725 [Defluviitaleaceae bacterium]|nr:hypothetical protein [Defluviitaleaceae bacterium]
MHPMKEYSAPNIPTLEYAKENPSLLKKLPQRWRKKAAAFACIGAVGLHRRGKRRWYNTPMDCP